MWKKTKIYNIKLKTLYFIKLMGYNSHINIFMRRVMKIQFNQDKVNNFLKVVFSQDFEQYYGMTNTYKCFEEQNLTAEIKASVLKKLSVTNHLNVPSFEEFWNWIRVKHGTQLSLMLTSFIYPRDEKKATHLKNVMRNNRDDDLWMHIKARVYKKWCSIVTEMQCVYAVAEGVHNNSLNWTVLVSPELDAIGIDFVVVKEVEGIKKVYPIQIKKDSFNAYAQKKYNALENFDKVSIKKKALQELNHELEKQKIKAHIESITILKYGVTRNDELPYDYLKRSENGFVYYDSKLLTDALDKNLN